MDSLSGQNKRGAALLQALVQEGALPELRHAFRTRDPRGTGLLAKSNLPPMKAMKAASASKANTSPMKAMKVAKSNLPPMKAMKAAKTASASKTNKSPMKAMKAAKTNLAPMKAAKAVVPPKNTAVNLPLTVTTTKGTKMKQRWTHFGTTNIRECWVVTEYVTKQPPIVRVWGKLV